MHLRGLDIARFLAFCGMVLVNFRIAAEVAPNGDLYSTLTDLLEGRAAALFVVLAGVGLALAKIPTTLLLKRAAFLFVVGMVNMLIFDADILHYYALYFVVGAAFMTRSDHMLWLGIAGFLIAAFAGLIALDYDAGWNWDTYTYADFWTLGGFLRHSLYNGWHPVVPWAAFLLFGLWLGRQDLACKYVQMRMVMAGVIVTVLANLPKHSFAGTELYDLFNTAPIPPTPFYIAAGAGTATAVMGLMLLFTPVLGRGAVLFTAPGRQTLTLYVAHILLGMGVLEGMGLLGGVLDTAQIFWISLGFCALSSLYALIWQFIAKRGPLEALMRWVTQ